MTIEQLRKLIGEKSQALATLSTKAQTAEAAQADIDALVAATKELTDLQTKLEQLIAADKAVAAVATPVVPAQPAPAKAAAQVKKDLKPVEKIGVAIQGLIKAKHMGIGHSQEAVYKAMGELGYEALAAEFDMEMKVNSVTNTGGGFTVPPNFNPDIIEFLNPVTAFLQGGPQEIPMPQGSYTQPGQASRPTASYRGEAQQIATSDLTFREINMKARLLSSIVPVTNQIIRYSAAQMVPFVQNSMGQVMGEKMDEAAFIGSGFSGAPVGILRIPGHFSTAATNSTTPTAANVDADVAKILNRIELYPRLRLGLAWIMAVRTYRYLSNMRNTDGSWTYPEMRGENPRFFDYPVLKSGVIAINGGGGTDESEIALVSFGNVLLGMTKALELATSSEATVNGVSMFDTDQTAIRATAEHDWTTRHVEDVMRLTAVRWGA